MLITFALIGFFFARTSTSLSGGSDSQCRAPHWTRIPRGLFVATREQQRGIAAASPSHHRSGDSTGTSIATAVFSGRYMRNNFLVHHEAPNYTHLTSTHMQATMAAAKQTLSAGLEKLQQSVDGGASAKVANLEVNYKDVNDSSNRITTDYGVRQNTTGTSETHALKTAS